MKKKRLTSLLVVLITFIVAVFLSMLMLKIFSGPKDDDEIATVEPAEELVEEEPEEKPEKKPVKEAYYSITNATSNNCTLKYGYLLLINPNFHVEDGFIAARKSELISLSYNYGIVEANPNNGDNLMDSVAALHLNEMINAYKGAYPGHTMKTRSCFRVKGTNCGRMCLATGTTDHHTGLTCDLIDDAYGSSLDTGQLGQHIEWQWLKANSFKYGFIDRFPLAWAGSSMSEPMVVNASGSTGLYETWHYRYVGVEAATEIATGKYNNGEYDSLEHYLKATGRVTDLVNATCKAE